MQRIDELLWEAKDDLIRAQKDYVINIRFDMGLSDEGLLIRCDGQLIKTVFINLMDNGCKYSLDRTVLVTLKSNDGSPHVEFENRGIGVAAQELKTIFDPFVRGTNTGSIEGYGIGLSLASQIMKLHQGFIRPELPAEGVTRFVAVFARNRA